MLQEPSFIAIFVITEYLLKNSILNKCLITMNAKPKELALMLTITIILFGLSLPNMKIAISDSSGGK